MVNKTEAVEVFYLEISFDDAVTPGMNGATLTYGYTRLITQPTAAFRAISSEYTLQEVTKFVIPNKF